MKSLEEKIKNYEKEKHLLKETYERECVEKNKELNDIINKLNIEINKLKLELKTKEEEILLNNLDKDQDKALNIQKINFLENEVNEWKSRYNIENKELSQIKTEKIYLIANIDKLKNEVKNLKNKITTYEINNENNNEKNMNMTISGKGFFNNNGLESRSRNKLLVELMSGQNYIKDFLEEIKNNTEKIMDMNKNILNNVNRGINDKNPILEKDKDANNNLEIKNNYYFSSKKIKNKEKYDHNDNHNQFFSYGKEKQTEKNKSELDLLLIQTNIQKKLNYNNNKENIISNNSKEIKKSSPKIKIVNHVLKKNTI